MNKQADDAIIETEQTNETQDVAVVPNETGNAIAKANSHEGITEVSIELNEVPDVSTLDDMVAGKSYVAKYRTQEDWHTLINQPTRAFYLGTKYIPNDKGEAILCAIFADKTGIFLSAQTMIMEATKMMLSMQPILITYLGKKKNKGEGSTNLFDVQELKTLPKPQGQK